MRNILIDAGSLIALFDRSDQYHLKSIHFLKEFQGQLWTTWPVITEVGHMLDFSTKTQIDFLEWIDRGGLQLFDLKDVHLKRIIQLSEKFNDVPMDLADASLIVASEAMGYREIASIDADFYVYRTVRNEYLYVSGSVALILNPGLCTIENGNIATQFQVAVFHPDFAAIYLAVFRIQYFSTGKFILIFFQVFQNFHTQHFLHVPLVIGIAQIANRIGILVWLGHHFDHLTKISTVLFVNLDYRSFSTGIVIDGRPQSNNDGL